MSEKETAQNVIESYRKRQSMAQKAPLIFGLAAVLLIVGAIILVFWLTGSNPPALSFLATQTPTSTQTSIPTETPTATQAPTHTPTELPTETPLPSETATPSGPFVYIVQENDTLDGIARQYNVDLLTLLALNPTIDRANPIIRVNQEILIPAPGQLLPTATDIPDEMRGVIEYTIATGDTLAAIADRFNSTVDAILNENADQITNANEIFVGQILKIPVNIATPIPTNTPGLSSTFPVAPTQTVGPSMTPTP